MKKYYLILAVGFIAFGACQKDEIVEETVELEVISEEYFRVEVNGESFETENASHIAGTVYPSYNTGVINFDFHGKLVDESNEVDIVKSFIFKVCFYDGPGTYYTGTTETVSWAYFWSAYDYWENHYEYGNEPGIVIVTNATDDFVEGTFEYEAYNDEQETMANVKGEFGLKLETYQAYLQM